MATRLYPRTANAAVLEKLANVKPGTCSRLRTIEERYATEKGPLHTQFNAASAAGDEATCNGLRQKFSSIEDREYNEVDSDDQMVALRNFESNGWGRLTREAYAIATELNPEYPSIGETHDPSILKRIIEAQGLDLPFGIQTDDLEGLCWN